MVQEAQGVWAPRVHQRKIGRLTSALTRLFEIGTIRLEPLPETILDESKASPMPDILLYDNELNQTRVIIEVCHTDGPRADLQKLVKLIDADLYGIREGFVYDYRTQQWFRYHFGDAGLTEAAAQSKILGFDLGQFV